MAVQLANKVNSNYVAPTNFQLNTDGSAVEVGNADPASLLNLNVATLGTTNGLDQLNTCGRGLKLVINITTITGTAPTLTVTLQGKDVVSGTYYTILASAALTATGATVLTVYPGLTAAANVTASDILPRTFRVSAVAGGTAVTSLVATIGASIIV